MLKLVFLLSTLLFSGCHDSSIYEEKTLGGVVSSYIRYQYRHQYIIFTSSFISPKMGLQNLITDSILYTGYKKLNDDILGKKITYKMNVCVKNCKIKDKPYITYFKIEN
ncbi:MAG: glycinin [Caudoviricetes sp.]|nr:MAG: glycinin [Caudoviricetes sp.]